MKTTTDLAWQNLIHDRRRLAVTVTGVAFAVLLIFMELGFLTGLLTSTTRLLELLDADLVMLSSARLTLPGTERFPRRRLTDAASVPGVASVTPVYLEAVAGILRQPGERGYPIRVVGVPEQGAGLRWSAASLPAVLGVPRATLVDQASRPRYELNDPAAWPNYRGELANRRVQIAGQVRLGVDFAADGNLIMSADSFADYFPQRHPGGHPLDVIDLAAIRLLPGQSAPAVLATLRASLPADVAIYSQAELVEREREFWRRSAPIGFIFLVGAVMGFIVGLVVCYQIIHADIADHVREFATLKAMGYPASYFVGLVLRQALYLSLLGFIPGALISFVGYRAVAMGTGLTLRLTPEILLVVYLATLAMCVGSGCLALRKLLTVEPAELF